MMLEMTLEQIAQTLPDDDVPRWFVVPILADDDAATEWASAMVNLIGEFFGADRQGIRQHLLETFHRASRDPMVEPFDQRLIYLPFGASDGVVVQLSIAPVGDGTRPDLLFDAAVGGQTYPGMSEVSREVFESDAGVQGLRGVRGFVSETDRPVTGNVSSAPVILQFIYAVRLPTIEGPADVLAVCTSSDAEIASAGYLAFGQMLISGQLFG